MASFTAARIPRAPASALFVVAFGLAMPVAVATVLITTLLRVLPVPADDEES